MDVTEINNRLNCQSIMKTVPFIIIINLTIKSAMAKILDLIGI